MKLSSVLLSICAITALVAGLIILGCDAGDYENRDHPFTQPDELNYAKDKTEDQVCHVDDLYIGDCADACTCCFWGQVDLKGNCVNKCSQTLIRYQNYPPAHTDIDEYKECVVGCFSLCEIEDHLTTCWQECKMYIEDA